MPPCVHPDRSAEFHAYDRSQPMYERTSVLCATPITRRTAKRLKAKAIRTANRIEIADQLEEIEQDRIETERMAKAEREQAELDYEADIMREIEEERAFYASLDREQRERYADDGYLDFTAESPFDCGGAAAGCAYCIAIDAGEEPYDPYGTIFEEGLR